MIGVLSGRPLTFRFARVEGSPVVRRLRRWPVESTFLFLVSLVGYLAFADVMVIQTHYINGDAYARVANADYVIGSRDPHLGAIGFVWPPLPSAAALPFLLLSHWFPFLATDGFAGSVAAAMVSAGSVVLLNLGLRRVGVVMPVRYLVLLAWLLNPMLIVYAAQGMSEGFEIFFMIAMALVFFRWAETNAPRTLTALGILAGLNALVREESVTLSVVIGLGVLLVSVSNRTRWREIETRMLLFGLPFALLFGGWILAQAVLLHDPLYFIHSAYANGSQASVNGNFGDLQIAGSTTWTGAMAFVFKQAAGLYPAGLVLAALVLLRLPFARNRRVGLTVLLMGLPVPLVDAYELHSAQSSLQLRYGMWIIGWAAVLGLYLVWDMRQSAHRIVPILGGVAIGLTLLAANAATFESMDKDDGRSQEYPLIVALENHTSLAPNGVMPDLIDDGARVASAVNAADSDHGLIAMDTFLGSNVFLNAPNPKQFVVTSDYDFEAVASQPQVYHVEYFLVPSPSFNGTLDRFNVLYPGLWSGGASWAQQVAYIGGDAGWKLFRITGPTGRG